jgi:S-formylglutathione hydrolase FrmB
MRDRRLRLVLGVGILAALAVSLLGGAVQAQQAAPAALKGRVVTETISAPSLVGNLIADKAEKTISVYLAPSYDSAQARYPVVYFLPGYGGGWYPFEDQMNRLIASGGVKEMIVVTVPGQHRFGGSFYVNSPVTGNWEDLIVADIVGYVDAHYRTLPQSVSRGIGGHSMGGYGALNLAMLHPDVFGAVYSLSPGLFDPSSTVPNLDVAERRRYRDRTQALAPGEGALRMGGGAATPTAWSTFPHTPASGGRNR